MNIGKNIFIAAFSLAAYIMLAACVSTPVQGSGPTQSQNSSPASYIGAESNSPYWMGDGARGDSIAILPIDQVILPLPLSRVPLPEILTGSARSIQRVKFFSDNSIG